MATAVLVVAGVFGHVTARPAAAASQASTRRMLAGCAHRDMCVVNDDRIVYNASGDSGAWPVAANEQADLVINNGSTYDMVVYEHGSSRREVFGWATGSLPLSMTTSIPS